MLETLKVLRPKLSEENEDKRRKNQRLKIVKHELKVKNLTEKKDRACLNVVVCKKREKEGKLKTNKHPSISTRKQTI